MDSLCLLEDKHFQDLTLENEKANNQSSCELTSSNSIHDSKLNIIKNKPPIPSQSIIKTMLKQNMVKSQLLQKNNYQVDEFGNDENCDESIASVHLNQSDLNQLDKDYNFNFSDDDDEDDECERQNEVLTNDNQHLNSDAERTPTNHSKRDVIKQINNDLKFFNLQESNKAYNEYLLLDESSNILRMSDVPFNYNQFDQVNAQLSQQNETNSQSITQSVDIDHNLTFQNSIESTERINQLVMQSVERQKRQLESVRNVFDARHSTISTSSNAFNIKNNERRISENNHRDNDKIDDDNLDCNQTLSMSNLNDANATNLTLNPPCKSFLMQNNYDENTGKELNSIYFKPQPNDNYDHTKDFADFGDHTNILNKEDTNKMFFTDNYANKNDANQDFPFDMALDDEEYRKNIFSSDKQSAQEQNFSDSIKPDKEQQMIKNNDFLKPNSSNFNKSSLNEISFGEFKSGAEFLEVIEKEEAENHNQFDLSVNPHELERNKIIQDGGGSSKNSSGDSGEKWWNHPDMLQDSKLEVTNCSMISTSINNNNKSNIEANNSILTTKSNNLSANFKRPLKSTSSNDQSPTKKLKHKVDVAEYFGVKSEMPNLASKDNENEQLNKYTNILETKCAKENVYSSIDTSTSDLNDKTLCHSNKIDEPNNNFEEDNTLSQSHSSTHMVDNFSFTINSSSNGDFLLPKQSKEPVQNQKPSFQLTKNQANPIPTIQKSSLNESSVMSTASVTTGAGSLNLKSIGQELDRVQNRLANSNKVRSATSNTSEMSKLQIPDPLLSSSSIRSSKSSSNLKVLMNMDETVSSINSSNVTTSSSTTTYNKKRQINSTTNKIGKDVKKSSSSSSSKQTNNSINSKSPTNKATTNSTTTNSQSSKQKASSSSLTSTPSKLAKSTSESSNLNSISTSSSTTLSTSSTTATFNNQDSFISSIPERTNDSTLIGNHHSNNLPKQINSKNEKTNLNSNTLNKHNLKNFENQTSVSEITSNERQSMPSATSAMMPPTISMSSNATSSNNTVVNQNPSFVNQMVASMFSNSSLSSTQSCNDIVPVAFLSMNAIQQMMLQQKFFADATNKSQIDSSNLSRQSIESINGNKLWVNTGFSNSSLSSTSVANGLSNMSSPVSTSVISASTTMNKFEVPTIELNTNEINFEAIAEGCSDSKRVFFKLNNLNQNGHILLDLQSSLNWKIEPVNNLKSSEFRKKLNSTTLKRFDDFMLKNKFKKTLTINFEKGVLQTSTTLNELKFEIVSNFNEFYVNLDTKDLNFFKDLYDQLEPIQIKAELSFYYCSNINNIENSINKSSSTTLSNIKKQLLNVIEVKFVLGYAKMRTSAFIESIDFEVYQHDKKLEENDSTLNLKSRKKMPKYEEDNDRTMTNFNDADSRQDSDELNSFSLEQLVPLSNGGNIDIQVACYFTYENKIEGTFSQQHELKFKEGYELKLIESVFSLEAKSRSKCYARLYLIKCENMNKIDDCLSIEMNKLKMIVEIKPNGFKSEIPINIFLKPSNRKSEIVNECRDTESTFMCRRPLRYSISNNSLSTASINSKKSQEIKLASSRTNLFFGKTLHKLSKETSLATQSLINEFSIQNTNDFLIECHIYLLTKDPNGQSQPQQNEIHSQNEPTKDVKSLFKFCQDMENTSNVMFDDSLTQLAVNLKPGEKLTLKLEFILPGNLIMYPNNIVEGTVKMTVNNFARRFYVNLVGFLCDSNLSINSNISKLNINHDNYMDKLLEFRNIKQIRYNIQLPTSENFSNKSKVFRKVLKLSNNIPKIFVNLNKCSIYPILYDNKHILELISLTEGKDKYFDIDINGLDKFQILFKLNFNAIFQKAKISEDSNEELTWFEIDKSINEFEIELELITSSSMTLVENSLNNLSLCLFCIENDINYYVMSNFKTAIHSENAQHNFLDSFIIKLINKNNLVSNNQFLANSSGLNSTRESLTNSIRSVSGEENSLSNSLLSTTSNKFKLTKEDCIKLIRQSIKCCHIKLEINDKKTEVTQNIQSSNRCDSLKKQFSLEINLDKSKQNDSLVSLKSNGANCDYDNTNTSRHYLNDLSNYSSTTNINPITTNETWSINTDSIFIENLKNKPNGSAKFFLKNNLMRKELFYSLKYPTNYLEIKPNSTGELEPLKSIELTIIPRKEVLEKLPWFGNISVWCNKIQKDIRVSLYPLTLAAITDDSSSQSNFTTSTIQRSLPSQNGSLNLTKSNSNISLKSALYPSISNNSQCSKTHLTTEQSSDLTQYTIDSSLSLTPLINANFTMLDELNVTKEIQNGSTILTAADQNSDELIQILRVGDDAQVKFPPVHLTHSKSVELTLNNQANTFVSWRAFSTGSAYLRVDDATTVLKSNYSTFCITPKSGFIPALQKQTIKITFCPLEAFGLFTQIFQLETRVDSASQQEVQKLSYSCKLVLSGKSIPIPEQKPSFNRILKSKGNLLDNLPNKTDAQIKNRDIESVLKNNSNLFKENKFTNSNSSLSSTNTSSIIGSTLVSSNSSTLSNSSQKKISIKENPIIFENTRPNQISKSSITIHNKENFDCNISIINVMEPFYCKHLSMKIVSKHYIRIPIEFKPRVPNDYKDNILIRVDSYETPLNCLVKGKCIP